MSEPTTTQSHGWIAVQADDVRASYPEAVALIEQEARANADRELREALGECVRLFEYEVPFVDGQRQAAFDAARRKGRALLDERKS